MTDTNRAALSPAPPVEDPDEVSLGEHLAVLLEARWLIAGAVVLATAIGIAWLVFGRPIYRAEALVQVEEDKRTLPGLESLSDMFPDKSATETEVEIMRSRSLLGAVVEELHLDVVAAPRYFPLFGSAVARRQDPRLGPAAPVLGLASYAWGGERIKVDRLDVPEALLEKQLSLVAGDAGHYRVLDPDGDLLVEGEVGKSSAGRGVEIIVADLPARSGTRFEITKRDPDECIRELKKALAIAEQGKKTGVVLLALEGPDSAQIAATVGALTTFYVRQNINRKSEEAAKTLDFVNAQMPVVKARLEAAEASLNAYRSKKGSVNLSREAEAFIERAADVEKALSETEGERAALRLRFTENHPAFKALMRKQQELAGEKAAIESRLKRFPDSEMESVRLSRDVEVSNQLYTFLVNKAHELNLVKSGATGNVRVLDSAHAPRRPVSPTPVAIPISLLMGLVGGVGLAYARKALHHGMEDPEMLERLTGIPVFASVPHSQVQKRTLHDASGAWVPLARSTPNDLSVESLRSLRTTLQFALMENSSKVVAIGGPSPGIGKSFVAVNLAHVLGDGGSRVLLVDGDMRKGGLHEYFSLERGPGLSDVIGGSTSLEKAIHREIAPNLDFLATGTLPPAPAELLMSIRFQAVVATATKQYDLVLIDTPPILAVTDAALIARHAGANLMVLKAGQHPIREINLAVRRMAQGGSRPQGFVFNNVHRGGSSAYGYSYHYQYDYGSSKENKSWLRRISGKRRGSTRG